jgi:hypothetical protein
MVFNKKSQSRTIFIIMIFLVSLFSLYAFSGSGSGTLVDPYEITTCLQLQEIDDNLSANYELVNDIDCSATLNFDPIGYCGSSYWCSTGPSFDGDFYGNNFTISNLTIINTSLSGVGIFASSNSEIIKDIYITNFNISGNQGVGTLVGGSDGNYIENVHISNSYVNGSQSVGGLAGYMGGYIVDSSSFINGVITSTSSRAGGLVGYGNYIANSYVENLSLTSNSGLSGGLIGYSWDGAINSYVVNSIINTTNSYDVGGLVGKAAGDIEDSYIENVTVYAEGHVGGITGHNYGRVMNSYAINSNIVSSADGVGGIAGHGYVYDSYFGGNVYSSGNQVGGIVGRGTVENSISSGTVTGISNVGGVIGRNDGLYNSLSLSNVSGVSNVGGLVGDNRNELFYSYFYGNVSGVSNVGGLVGYGYNSNSDIDSSFFIGNLNATTNYGSIIGENNGGFINNSFWLNSTNFPLWGIGGINQSINISSENSVSYFYSSLNTLYNNWNSSIWYFSGNKLPYLSSNFGSKLLSGLEIKDDMECQISSVSWIDCDTLVFGDVLTGVKNKIEVTSGGVITNFTVDLYNELRSLYYFQNISLSENGSDWEITGLNYLINNSGDFTIDFQLSDNYSNFAYKSLSFFIDYGTLSMSLNSPNKFNISQNSSFTSIYTLECNNGECGDVVSTLSVDYSVEKIGITSDSNINSLFVNNEYLFIGLNDGTISVYNKSDLSLYTTLVVPQTLIQGIDVRDGLIYVFMYSQGVQAFNYSDTSTPFGLVYSSSYSSSHYPLEDFDFDENYLYIGNGGYNDPSYMFYKNNLSTYSQITLPSGSGTESLTVDEDFIYLVRSQYVSGNDTLYIYNKSNLTDSSTLTLTEPATYWRVDLINNGGYLYHSGGSFPNSFISKYDTSTKTQVGFSNSNLVYPKIVDINNQTILLMGDGVDGGVEIYNSSDLSLINFFETTLSTSPNKPLIYDTTEDIFYGLSYNNEVLKFNRSVFYSQPFNFTAIKNSSTDSCLSNMFTGDSCVLSWDIDANGNIGSTYILDVLSNPTYGYNENAETVNITVTSLTNIPVMQVNFITPTTNVTLNSSSFFINVSSNVSLLNCVLNLNGVPTSDIFSISNTTCSLNKTNIFGSNDYSVLVYGSNSEYNETITQNVILSALNSENFNTSSLFPFSSFYVLISTILFYFIFS